MSEPEFVLAWADLPIQPDPENTSLEIAMPNQLDEVVRRLAGASDDDIDDAYRIMTGFVIPEPSELVKPEATGSKEVTYYVTDLDGDLVVEGGLSRGAAVDRAKEYLGEHRARARDNLRDAANRLWDDEYLPADATYTRIHGRWVILAGSYIHSQSPSFNDILALRAAGVLEGEA